MTKIIPNDIANIRNKKGITQTELAKRLNITVWHLNKIENHKKPLTTTLALRIAEELSVTFNEIFLQ